MNISNALLIKWSLINQGVKFKKRFLNSLFFFIMCTLKEMPATTFNISRF